MDSRLHRAEGTIDDAGDFFAGQSFTVTEKYAVSLRHRKPGNVAPNRSFPFRIVKLQRPAVGATEPIGPSIRDAMESFTAPTATLQST